MNEKVIHPWIPTWDLEPDNSIAHYAQFAFDEWLKYQGLKEILTDETTDFIKYYRDENDDVFSVRMDLDFCSQLPFKDEFAEREFGREILKSLGLFARDSADGSHLTCSRLARSLTAEVFLSAYGAFELLPDK